MSATGLRHFVSVALLLISTAVALLAQGDIMARAASGQVSPQYSLGPMDRLRVNVSEWSSANGELRQRIATDVTVDPSGYIPLPPLGNITAIGLTTNELASAISKALQDREHMVNSPITTVEILLFRPFYILGDVEKPGEHPYQPGLTVLHAVSIAGGYSRRIDVSLSRIERDIITAAGDLRSSSDRRTKLLIRRARLEAELASKDTVTLPTELLQLTGNMQGDPLVVAEQEFMNTRRKALAAEKKRLADLHILLESQLRAMQAQLDTENVQSASVAKELDEQRTLVAKRLTTAARAFVIEQALLSIEVRKGEIETDRLRVRQSLLETESAADKLDITRQTEVQIELSTLALELSETEAKIATARALLLEAQSYGPNDSLTGNDMIVTYEIVRAGVSGRGTQSAEEATPILPGDIIKVSRVRPSSPGGVRLVAP